jgi:hypothetical protein
MNRAAPVRDGEYARAALPVDRSSVGDGAAEYLQSVRREACTIADVMVSASARSEAPRSVCVQKRPRPSPTQWELAALESFATLHDYVGSCDAWQEAGGVLPAAHCDAAALRSLVLGAGAAPSQAQVAGRRQARRRSRHPVDIEDWPSSEDEVCDEGHCDDDEPRRSPTRLPLATAAGADSLPAGASRHDGEASRLPWLAAVMALGQQDVRSLLEDAVAAAVRSRNAPADSVGASVAGARGIDLHLALWLYALLSRLQKPLLAVDGSVLRQLYVLCKGQKEDLQRIGAASDSSTALAAALDTLLVVAGTFFGQRLSYE